MMENIPMQYIDSESSPKNESNLEDGTTAESISNEEVDNTLKSESNADDENKTEGGSNADGQNNDSINRRQSWWRLSSTIERVLAGLLICTTIIMFIIGVTCFLRNHEAAVEKRTCMTPSCVHTASRVLADMDPTVKPCDNFYKFACGNFIRDQEIPDGKSNTDKWSAIRDNVRSQIRIVLEEPTKPKEQKPFVLVKNLYKACMNTSLNQSLEILPFSKTLESFGGWPVLKGDKWDEEEFDWREMTKDFRKKGFIFNPFIKVSIESVKTDPFKYSIQLDRLSDSDFGYIRKYLIRGMEHHIVIAYYNYMIDIAVLLGAPRERAEAEMKNALLFEMTLADISTKTKRNVPIHYKVVDLQPEYIDALLPPGLTYEDVAEVRGEEKHNLRDIQELLYNSPEKVVANYLMWKITSDNIELLTEDFRKRELEYKAVVDGMKQIERPRMEYCTGLIKERFNKVLYTLYARKYFNADARNNVTDMVNRIKAEAIKLLKNVDWMDENTRKEALEISENMTTYIGYPDELLDINQLEEYYKDVEIDENKFRQSLLNMKAFFADKYYNHLKNSAKKKKEWRVQKDFTNTTAFYMSFDNSINFLIGILQGVFFSADHPQYMNYGAIGYIIGHEITHALNNQNKSLDLGDSSVAITYWASATREAYSKRAQCINEQYGNYTMEEVNLKIKVNNTQEENVADNGAVKEAYLAYAKWVEDNGEEPQLPGLDYTSRQMFWLSAASIWCSKYTPEAMKKYIEENEHSPKKFRVLGPLSNSEDFAKDFHCPPGSPMNPQHKCKVW